jgi:hypothetical protein
LKISELANNQNKKIVDQAVAASFNLSYFVLDNLNERESTTV